MSPGQRVVVTGLGYVTALGFDDADHEGALREGRPGARPITRFNPAGMKTSVGGECDAARLERKLLDRFPAPALRSLGVDTQLVLWAAAAALEDAALEPAGIAAPFPAVLGTTLEGFAQGEAWYAETLRRGREHARARRLLNASAGGQVATLSGILGIPLDPLVVSNACATGVSAIGRLFLRIRSGRASVGLAGGYDSLCPFIQAGFDSLGALTANGCRPFDRGRAGFFIGDGAGVLVLESLDSARRRGARIRGEIVGYGQSVDAYHQTHPQPEGRGIARAITRCLESADVPPDAVDYINAHGTGTPANDAAEARGILLAFGEETAKRVPISSTKALVGHTLGAAGAVEQCFTFLALSHGFLPVQAGLADPDPACPLNFVRRPEGTPRIAMNNSFGFGGANGVLLSRKWEPEGP